MERIVKLEEQVRKEKNKQKRLILYNILIQEYYNLYKRYKNPEFLDKALGLIDEIGEKNSSTLNILGLIYIEKKEYNKAISIFNELLDSHKLSTDDKDIILYNLALAYFGKGELKNAYNILKSLTLTSKGEINTLSRKLLAKVCLKLGESNITYVNEAKEILESLDMPSEDLAVAYAVLAKHNNDKYFLEKAKKIATMLGNERLLADILSISDNEEDLKEAIRLYAKIGDYKNQLKPLYKLSRSDQSIFTEILDRLKNIEDSKDKLEILYDIYRRTNLIYFLKEAIKTAEKIEDYLFLARAYVELANYEDEASNLKKAVLFYEKYIQSKQ
ncbi:CDC27 family protein [Sulfolobus tengchongensis]|uniref:CDC27 family protein n=1 Tax=Sulfolobus tengchongensis TaxID=207809 RepID=A0AAX4L103_9CREN